MKANILVVDDTPDNLHLLMGILSKQGYKVRPASNGLWALSTARVEPPDLILLDIIMPGMNGYQVCEQLKTDELTRDIPVILMTSLSDTAHKVRGFECGAVDYITKPLDYEEVVVRVSTHLRSKRVQKELKTQNAALADREAQLTHLVQEQTKAIKAHAIKIQHLSMALIRALENANALNDNDTGNHIERVGAYSAFIAEHYGCDRDFVQRIRLYAPLHDVGKVGLPDVLLKKPGKYTEEESVQMQQHVVFGAKLLDYPGIDVMARNIALYHHERWDGTGYVDQLAGEEIPLEARIVSLADVYDALVNRRIYKDAFSEEQAERIIRDESGRHFDPTLVEIFLRYSNKIRKIKESVTAQPQSTQRPQSSSIQYSVFSNHLSFAL